MSTACHIGRAHQVANRRTAIHSVLTVLCLVAAIPSAHAQNENDFFEKNVALTIFDSGVTESGLPRIKMLRPTHKDEQPKLAPGADVQENAGGGTPNSAADATQSANLENDTVKPGTAPTDANGQPLDPSQAIIAKYGDPMKQAPVLAQDNAPKPFRAMMEALDSGDDKLAYQYAQQYVKHIHNLDQRSKRAMLIQSMAMEKTGLAASPMAGDSEYEALKSVLEGEQATAAGGDVAAESSPTGGQHLTQIDPRAKTLIQRAFTAQDPKSVANVGADLEVEDDESDAALAKKAQGDRAAAAKEQAERAQFRQAFAGRTPVDPNGQVDIYFFFRTTDKSSVAMGREIQLLASKIPVGQGVRLVGLTLDAEDESSIAAYRRETGAKFPIKSGSVLAQRLKIRGVPSTVAVARTNYDAVIEEGFRKAYFLEELIRFMQGKR